MILTTLKSPFLYFVSSFMSSEWLKLESSDFINRLGTPSISLEMTNSLYGHCHCHVLIFKFWVPITCVESPLKKLVQH